MAGLARENPKTPEGKFVAVLRADGTWVDTPFFVLLFTDETAYHTLMAHHREAETRHYDPNYRADVKRLARSVIEMPKGLTKRADEPSERRRSGYAVALARCLGRPGGQWCGKPELPAGPCFLFDHSDGSKWVLPVSAVVAKRSGAPDAEAGEHFRKFPALALQWALANMDDDDLAEAMVMLSPPVAPKLSSILRMAKVSVREEAKERVRPVEECAPPADPPVLTAGEAGGSDAGRPPALAVGLSDTAEASGANAGGGVVDTAEAWS